MSLITVLKNLGIEPQTETEWEIYTDIWYGNLEIF